MFKMGVLIEYAGIVEGEKISNVSYQFIDTGTIGKAKKLALNLYNSLEEEKKGWVSIAVVLFNKQTQYPEYYYEVYN